jgi:hypothetical protein
VHMAMCLNLNLWHIYISKRNCALKLFTHIISKDIASLLLLQCMRRKHTCNDISLSIHSVFKYDLCRDAEDVHLQV